MTLSLKQAKIILLPYLEGGAVTPAKVKAAFAKAILEIHPDVSKPQHLCSPLTVSDLKLARDVWLTALGVGDAVCPVCRNTGVMSVNFRPTPCVKGCKPD